MKKKEKNEKNKAKTFGKVVGFIAKKGGIGFIIGAIIFGSVGVYAATVIAGSQVSYSNSQSGLNSTDVQGALDELYVMAQNHCPKGYICKQKLCKRVTEEESLHKETCNQSSTSQYCRVDGHGYGGIITYGNLGKSGILTTGDAFDCDVNGDGKYDSETERFYYISDSTNGITTNSNVAVLVYYNNVSAGEPSNSTAYAYDSSNKNKNGPVTAIAQLPTTIQWSNVSLINTTRQITNQLGGTTTSGSVDLPTDFSYAGRAARLLTYQEVNTGCYDGTNAITSSKGLSSKCQFLMENTKYSNSSLATYGGWLESPRSSSSSTVWNVYSIGRRVYSASASSTSGYGVRPAIEVLKSNISY